LQLTSGAKIKSFVPFRTSRTHAHPPAGSLQISTLLFVCAASTPHSTSTLLIPLALAKTCIGIRKTVQYRREEAHRQFRNDYWKLGSGNKIRKKNELLGLLKQISTSVNGKNMTRLRELYVRQQPGLLSYEGLGARELRSFVTQRGLSLQTNPKPSLAILKTHLEQADDDASFDRFSDLPPELRQQIFMQYFDSFDEPPCNTSDSEPGGQPPITRVSRQTRLEALPMFYSRFSFTFCTTWCYTASICVNKRFIRNTAAQNFARIRFLKLSGYIYQDHATHLTMSISISLEDDECSTKISDVICHLGREHSQTVVNRVRSLLMLESHTFIRSIAAREGWQKLQKDDIPILHNMLRSAVRQAKSLTD
jgi:hypothetical protein